MTRRNNNPNDRKRNNKKNNNNRNNSNNATDNSNNDKTPCGLYSLQHPYNNTPQQHPHHCYEHNHLHQQNRRYLARTQPNSRNGRNQQSYRPPRVPLVVSSVGVFVRRGVKRRDVSGAMISARCVMQQYPRPQPRQDGVGKEEEEGDAVFGAERGVETEEDVDMEMDPEEESVDHGDGEEEEDEEL